MNIKRTRYRHRPRILASTRIATVLYVLGIGVALHAPLGASATGLGGGSRDHTTNVYRDGNGPLNDSRADARSRNVRGTSINNVNRNRDVHVTVDDDRHGGWDDDYHPVATAAAITATVAVTSAIVGSIVHSVPSNCVPANYGGMIYQQCGGTWYQPQGSQYMVVNPPY